eukprot:m.114184 g.114184  ORF g.114184 m.114184 type:complete len:306 (+) comp17117_c0_seq4:631-1548(+)
MPGKLVASRTAHIRFSFPPRTPEVPKPGVPLEPFTTSRKTTMARTARSIDHVYQGSSARQQCRVSSAALSVLSARALAQTETAVFRAPGKNKRALPDFFVRIRRRSRRVPPTTSVRRALTCRTRATRSPSARRARVVPRSTSPALSWCGGWPLIHTDRLYGIGSFPVKQKVGSTPAVVCQLISDRCMQLVNVGQCGGVFGVAVQHVTVLCCKEPHQGIVVSVCRGTHERNLFLTGVHHCWRAHARAGSVREPSLLAQGGGPVAATAGHQAVPPTVDRRHRTGQAESDQHRAAVRFGAQRGDDAGG